MEILFTNWLKKTFKKKEVKTENCQYSAECFKLLQLIIDNEASEEQKQYFSDHLEKCIYCIKYYHLEKQIKQTLQNKIPKKQIPSGLVEAIKNQISQTV